MSERQKIFVGSVCFPFCQVGYRSAKFVVELGIFFQLRNFSVHSGFGKKSSSKKFCLFFPILIFFMLFNENFKKVVFIISRSVLCF